MRSDATVNAYVTGTTRSVAGGRTYRAASSNPKSLRLTAGTYDVVVGSVEIAGKPEQRWEKVVIEPQGKVDLRHDFASATLKIGSRRAGALEDAVVQVADAAGASVDGARTYNRENSNPTTFTLVPGTYRVKVKAVKGGGERRLEVTLGAGEETEKVVDFGKAP